MLGKNSIGIPMHLTINGETKSFEQLLSVEQLLKTLAVEPKKIAVERNRVVVSKSAYATTLLAEGDRLEIIEFIGGG